MKKFSVRAVPEQIKSKPEGPCLYGEQNWNISVEPYSKLFRFWRAYPIYSKEMQLGKLKYLKTIRQAIGLLLCGSQSRSSICSGCCLLAVPP